MNEKSRKMPIQHYVIFISANATYELGEFDLAKEFFNFAFKKSDGRCFEDEDPKYLEFF